MNGRIECKRGLWLLLRLGHFSKRRRAAIHEWFPLHLTCRRFDQQGCLEAARHCRRGVPSETATHLTHIHNDRVFAWDLLLYTGPREKRSMIADKAHTKTITIGIIEGERHPGLPSKAKTVRLTLIGHHPIFIGDAETHQIMRVFLREHPGNEKSKTDTETLLHPDDKRYVDWHTYNHCGTAAPARRSTPADIASTQLRAGLRGSTRKKTSSMRVSESQPASQSSRARQRWREDSDGVRMRPWTRTAHHGPRLDCAMQWRQRGLEKAARAPHLPLSR